MRTRYDDPEYTPSSSQRCHWVFTLFYEKESDFACLYREENYRAIVFQLEICPTTGRKHVQGYVEFSRSMRFSAVVRILGGRARVYVRLGTQTDAVRYVTKEETRVPSTQPVRLGTLRAEDGQSSDAYTCFRDALDDSEQSIRTVAVNHFPLMMKHRNAAIWYRSLDTPKRIWNPRVVVLWGASGTGKTRAANDLFPKAYWLCPPNVRNGPIWFTGYAGEADIIIDDFYGWMQWTQLLRLLDRYPCNVLVHGSSVPFLGRNIVITSNVHPKEWYDYEKSDFMKYEALSRRIDRIDHFLVQDT